LASGLLNRGGVSGKPFTSDELDRLMAARSIFEPWITSLECHAPDTAGTSG
jgi:hypothetical protein